MIKSIMKLGFNWYSAKQTSELGAKSVEILREHLKGLCKLR